MEAIATAVGAERAAIRLSPWSTFQGKNLNSLLKQS
jgi:hypothetical protein